VAEIRRKLEEKTTEELASAYREQDDENWSPEAFEAMRQILTARSAPVPTLMPKEPKPPEPPKYVNYSDVPWYRRSRTNSAFLVCHVLTCGLLPLILWVCINLLTGDIYYNRRDDRGHLATWSNANKVAAVVILLLSLVFVLVVLRRE